MKIITTDKEASLRKQARQIANVGCDTCPFCGEPAAPNCVRVTYADGFVYFKDMREDCYRCDSCGAEWRSDPYWY